MKAIWKGAIIAESEETRVIEGNHYFPVDSLRMEHFEKSDLTSVCHWKGTANYYNVTVGGKTNENAAWYYPTTSELAKSIEGRIAFWRGVEVVE